MKVWSTKTLIDLKVAAQNLILELPAHCIVLLYGDVGVGKTTFVRFVAESLGIDKASSPTFAIHQTYSSATQTIEHFDLYRLSGEDDVESTGLWDLLSDKDPKWIFIEWAERINPDWISVATFRCDFTPGEIRFTPRAARPVKV